MKLLHLADVHLDRPFRGVTPAEARALRADLLGAFRRCLDAAREHAVDAVTIGGDLWEDEHVTLDTRRTVARALGELGVPVVIVAGNHDPLLPGGAWERTEWPANVQVLGSDGLAEAALPGGVSVWGVSWGAGPLTAGFLAAPPALDPARTNLLLLHGTSTPVAFFAADSGHCPFDPAAVRAAGFARCLAGHIHAGSDDGTVVYPGSPEPLDWTETGTHACALVEVAGGAVHVELLPVNRRAAAEVPVQCEGAESSAEVEERVRAAAEAAIAEAGRPAAGVVLSLRLEGAVVPGCKVAPAELAAGLRQRLGLAAARVVDRTHELVPLDELVQRHSVDGAFARRLQARLQVAEEAGDVQEGERLRLALALGVGALQGRSDLVDLDL